MGDPEFRKRVMALVSALRVATLILMAAFLADALRFHNLLAHDQAVVLAWRQDRGCQDGKGFSGSTCAYESARIIGKNSGLHRRSRHVPILYLLRSDGAQERAQLDSGLWDNERQIFNTVQKGDIVNVQIFNDKTTMVYANGNAVQTYAAPPLVLGLDTSNWKFDLLEVLLLPLGAWAGLFILYRRYPMLRDTS